MNRYILPVAALAAAFGLGVAAGRYWTEKRLESDYDRRLDEEIKETKKYYIKLAKREEYSDPTLLVEKTDEITEEFEKIDPDDFLETVDIEEFQRRRITQYDRPAPAPPPRDLRIPYIISYDVFMENEFEYDQRTLTYFSKDDVLIEERDTPVDDYVKIVGPDAMDNFGTDSNDPNIVYVRNDFLSMDFEICYDPGSFEETVLGHIKHGDSRKKIRKFRIDDD